MHEPNELLRKSLHVVFGLFAFTLKWLPWWLAAGVAAFAALGNWLVLHRIVGKTVSRHERGWDAGIVLYPLMVMVLIVLFRHDLHIAGVAWATLAFGDGFATIAGRTLGEATLPWNRNKTWAGFIGFVLLAFPPAYLVSWHLSDVPTWWPRWVIILVILLAGAIAESLDLGLDDNLTVPFAAAVAAWILLNTFAPQFQLDSRARTWLVINTALAVIGFVLRTVDVSGLIGGWVLGAVLIVCGGIELYLVLLTFFIIGTAATKIGYRAKAREGLAQEKGGRRGFGHAFANVGVAAICAIAISFAGRTTGTSTVLWWAAVAALATAAADTVASELGPMLGKRAFLPLTFRAVPRGTEGAISVAGTVAGILGALVVATVAVVAARTPQAVLLASLVVIAAFLGSYLESIVGSWNRRQTRPIANGALNFFNTVAGAALLFVAWQIAV